LDYSEDSFELEYKKYDKLVKDDLKNLPYYKTNLCYRTYNKYKSRCIENDRVLPMCKSVCETFNKKFDEFQNVSSTYSSICEGYPETNCYDGSEMEKKYYGYDSLEKYCKYSDDKSKISCDGKANDKTPTSGNAKSETKNNSPTKNKSNNSTIYISIGVGVLVIIILIASFCLFKRKKSKKSKNNDKIAPKENKYFLNRINVVESSMETISERFKRFENDAKTSNLQLLDEQLNKGIDEIEKMNRDRFKSLYDNTISTKEILESATVIPGDKTRPESSNYSFNNDIVQNENNNTNNGDNNNDQSDNASNSTTLTNEYMIVKYPFEITQDDEIKLEPGDCIKLEKIYSDGWAAGYNINRKSYGAFPMICCGDILDKDGNVLVKMDHSQLGEEQQSRDEEYIKIDRNSRRASVVPSEITRRSQIRESVLSFNDSEINIFGVSSFGGQKNSSIRNSSISDNSGSGVQRTSTFNSILSPLANEANNSMSIQRNSTFNSSGNILVNGNEISSIEVERTSTVNSVGVPLANDSGIPRSTTFNTPTIVVSNANDNTSPNINTIEEEEDKNSSKESLLHSN
jgi:hypothetical protein